MSSRILSVIRPALGLLGVLFMLVLGAQGCAAYDTLVDKDAVAAEKWADLDAALQRRADLVPNLVATVKGSAKHEEETLAQVTAARAEVGKVRLTADDLTDPEKIAAFQRAQDGLQSALSRLLVVQERYPDLKANGAFHDLQVQLEGTENRILRAREEYNAAARDYNSELAHVRGKAVNRVTGKPFAPRPYFTATAGAATPPEVSF